MENPFVRIEQKSLARLERSRYHAPLECGRGRFGLGADIIRVKLPTDHHASVGSPGVMAQGRSKGQTGGPNHYGSTNNPKVSTQMNQQADSNTLFGRTNAAENKPSVSDERVTSSERQQREERHEAREQREERHHERKQELDRRQDHRQEAQRHERKSTKEKSPFDGSILEVKHVDLKR